METSYAIDALLPPEMASKAEETGTKKPLIKFEMVLTALPIPGDNKAEKAGAIVINQKNPTRLINQ